MELTTSPWEGRLVRLRALEEADVDVFLAADEDGAGARAGWRVFPPRSRRDVEDWICQITQGGGDGDEFRVAVVSLETGDVVGTLNTQQCDPAAGTFGYGITIWPWQRRRGYGSDAVVVALRYLFGERRYQKCTVGVLSFNDASAALHRSLGFVEEGRVRRAHFRAGRHWDELLFGITVEEFEQRWGFGALS